MLKRILVGVSGTPALDAKISYCLDLAKRHGADLGVISIVDADRLSNLGPVPIGAGHRARKLAEHRISASHVRDDEALQKFARMAEEAGVKSDLIREEGDPLDVISSQWRFYDLCVLGARGWFDYGVINEPVNALLEVFAGGVRPILAVPSEFGSVNRVMVAYNGSPEASKALKHFLIMRPYEQCVLDLVCVGRTESGEDPDHALSHAAEYAQAHGFETVQTKLEGECCDALLAHAAATSANLIVMGASYRRILMYERFGADTLAILKNSPLPLFISH